MISVLNWKEYDRGSMRGFFDLRYHGLSIKGCRLMQGNDGLWFSFPQVKGEQDGETKYFDQMFLSSLERDHVRKLILLDLQQQGHIDGQKPKQAPRPKQAPEDLSQHLPGPQDDIDVPF